MATGIYVVEDVFDHTRWVVIAASAQEAGDYVAREPERVEVGRLGNFEPGLTGAAMVTASPVVAQEITRRAV